jgi:hypothetical protein
LPPGVVEEIPIRKTNCLSHATTWRVFVFPELLRLLPPQADKQANFSWALIFWSFLIKQKGHKKEQLSYQIQPFIHNRFDASL